MRCFSLFYQFVHEFIHTFSSFAHISRCLPSRRRFSAQRPVGNLGYASHPCPLDPQGQLEGGEDLWVSKGVEDGIEGRVSVCHEDCDDDGREVGESGEQGDGVHRVQREPADREEDEHEEDALRRGRLLNVCIDNQSCEG